MNGAGTYENQAIVETVFQKTSRIVANIANHPLPASDMATLIMAILAAARHVGDAPVRVLDFGGAAGIHAFTLRHAFPDVALRWAVVETPAMAGRCRPLEDAGLRYFTSIEDGLDWLGDLDVVNCSGAIQYVPDPEETMLRLLAPAPRCVSVSRTPLCKGDRHTQIQKSMLGDNGPGPLPEGIANCEISYPVTLMNRTAFFALFEPQYRRVVSLDLKPFGMEENGVPIMQFNCLFTRKGGLGQS